MFGKYVWLNMDKVIKLFSQFLIGFVLARLVDTDTFGLYWYSLSISVIVMEVSVLGLQSLITSKILDLPNEYKSLIGTAHTLRAVCGVLVTIITTIILYFLENIEVTLLTLIFCLSACFRAGESFESYAQTVNKVEYAAKIRVICFSFFLPLKIFTIYLTQNVLLLGLLMLVEAAVIYFFIRRLLIIKCVKFYCGTLARELLASGGYLLLSSISAIAYLKLDSIMIKNIIGLTEVAYYNVGTTIVQSCWFLALNYCVLYFPIIHKSSNRNKEFKRHYIRLFGGGILLSIFIYLISDFLIVKVYGEKYADSVFISQIYSLILPIYFFRALLSKWILISKNYKYSLYSHSIGLISNIVLNFILIEKYGGVGAAISTVIAFFASTFIFLIMFSKTRKHLISIVKA